MNRKINREKAVFVVYQYLLVPRNVNDLIEDMFADEKETEDNYIFNVIDQSINNIERFTGYINNILEGWTFDRLGYIEQAVLLNGCAEFDLKQVEAPVIIDEYVRITKKYCDPDSYKLINGILDTI